MTAEIKDIIKKGGIEEVLAYLKEYGCCYGTDIAKGIGLSNKTVVNSLYRLSRQGRVQKFRVAFRSSRKYGQFGIFGVSHKRYLYYIDRNALIEYLIKTLRPLGNSYITMLKYRLPRKDLELIDNAVRKKAEKGDLKHGI